MNWENNIKETLENRRIDPSGPSWNSLSQRLDSAQHRRNKSHYWWRGIAASVAAILIAVTVYYKSNEIRLQHPDVVKRPNEAVEEQPQTIYSVHEKQPVEPTVIQNHNSTESKNSSMNEDEKSLEAVASLNQDSPAVEKNVADSVLGTDARPMGATIEMAQTLVDVRSHLDSKRDASRADDEIESLLLSAQQEIASQAFLNERLVSVDSKALLQEVETEVRQSFRNKVFEALKNSYESLKTAVAERKN